jgi:hypothetical protein
MSTTSGASTFQSASGVAVTVTKSAVMNTDATLSIASTIATHPSAAAGSEIVAGPPTAVPTLNFIAAGFGVRSVRTATGVDLLRSTDNSTGRLS